MNGQSTVPQLYSSFLLPCLLGTNICMSSLNGYPFRGRHRGQLACASSLFSIAKWEFAIRILEKRFGDANKKFVDCSESPDDTDLGELKIPF